MLASSNLSAITEATKPYPEYGDEIGEANAELRENVRVAMTIQTILEPRSGRERNINTGFTVDYEHPDAKKAQQVAR